MILRTWTFYGLVAATGALLMSSDLLGELLDNSKEDKQPKSVQQSEANEQISVAEARGRAKLLHETYAATLDIVHRQYFREDQKIPIPARAMEDVFSRVGRRSNVKARWIAVNANAMSLDHEPKGKFEKQAARALASGKKEFELVENGQYRRVAPITLFSSCLKCHAPPPLNQNRARVAGLVINMPVGKE